MTNIQAAIGLTLAGPSNYDSLVRYARERALALR